jgi:hypothetical protein
VISLDRYNPEQSAPAWVHQALKETAMENYIWLIVVAGGALALGAALAFGVLQRRLTPGEKHAQDEKVQRLYDKK